MKSFVGITGVTSVGKSAVAVHLAKLIGTEIVSADSMQIYKGMDIGTAKITPCEMMDIRHHMLDIVEPCQNFSSFDYQQRASQIIDTMDTLPIVVGGTGFYFDSLLYPPEFGNGNEQRRRELSKILATEGLTALQAHLKQIDAETYNAIDINNPKRVVRAIEIAESGGQRIAGRGKIKPKYNMILFVLQRDRQEVYNQIDKRVDLMFENGLVDEVKNIVDKYGVCDTPAFAAIGYKEVVEYLQGKTTLAETIDKVKLNTRHYAKRQITYYKKMNVTEYIDVANHSSEEIATYIYEQLQSRHDITNK